MMRYILLSFLLSCFSLSTVQAFTLSPANINHWQFLDKNGMVFPWYTMPFLDILATWDVKNWDVFEWGGGYSTAWWAAHCHEVVTVDNHAEWILSVDQYLGELQLSNAVLKMRAADFGAHPNISDGGDASDYVNAIDEDDRLYDCIIIDGHHRNTCAIAALRHIKPNGIIILDNANQASIELNSQKTFELFKEYAHYSYLQPGHADWRTDYWIITK